MMGPRQLAQLRTLLIILLLSVPVRAWSAQLDEEACTKLKEEHAKLVQQGTRSTMERGPEWARLNASAALMKDIARLIEVEEQLLFRCPQPKPPVPAKEDQAEAVAAPDKQGNKPKTKTKPSANAGTKAQAGAADASKARPTPAAAKAPATAPSAKSKAKPADAYVPAPKAPPASTPGATQQ
jgi:hypothetical protein